MLPSEEIEKGDELVKPSALSVAVNVPVIAPPSSFPVPEVLPPIVAGSFAKSTVIFKEDDGADTLFVESAAVTIKE